MEKKRKALVWKTLFAPAAGIVLAIFFFIPQSVLASSHDTEGFLCII